MAIGDFVRSRSTRAAPRTNSNSGNHHHRGGGGDGDASSLCASLSDGEAPDDVGIVEVPLMENHKPSHQPSSSNSHKGGRIILTAKRLLHRLRLCLLLKSQRQPATAKAARGGSNHRQKKKSPWRWFSHLLLLLLLAFLLLLLLGGGTDSGRKVLHALGIKKMTHQEQWKMKLNANLAAQEREHARQHKPSQRRPWEELILEKSRTDILQTLLQEELQKMPSVPFVSWGVYHMYRMSFPPELNIPNIKGHESAVDGQPPVTEKLQGHQILIAHRVPNPKRLDYSIPHWEHRIKRDGVPNVGIYLMGDEFNYGSSFLNDELDGTRSPFAFLIRDYYFDPLKNARHTRVVQLGTMTCQRKKLACRVGPPDAVFANMLPSAVKVELRPPATQIKRASERSRKCYWAGSDRNDRRDMVAYFERAGGCDVYLTPGFNQGHNKTVYADILADSVFGLVPSGNSPETHRLAELLMFGGIPAMLDRDAKAAFLHSYAEPIPMITGRTWKQVHQRMQALSSDDLDKLQQKVLQWWDHHWDCVHQDLRWILAQSHAVSEGRDLCSSFHTEVEKRLQWLRWGKSSK